jgi:hypothetical protein
VLQLFLAVVGVGRLVRPMSRSPAVTAAIRRARSRVLREFTLDPVPMVVVAVALQEQ